MATSSDRTHSGPQIETLRVADSRKGIVATLSYAYCVVNTETDKMLLTEETILKGMSSSQSYCIAHMNIQDQNVNNET